MATAWRKLGPALGAWLLTALMRTTWVHWRTGWPSGGL